MYIPEKKEYLVNYIKFKFLKIIVIIPENFPIIMV